MLVGPAARAAAPGDVGAARERIERAERARAAAEARRRAAAAAAAAAAARAAQLAEARAAAEAKLADARRATQAAAARMQALDQARREAAAGLAARAAALAPLLPLIERLSLYPAETLLAVPAPPDQAVRGLLVLRGITREVAAQAAALGAQREKLWAAEAALTAEAPALAAAEAAQAQAEAALDQQLAVANSDRAAAEAEEAAAAQAAARLAAHAASLRDLLARLEAARHAAAVERARREAAAAAAREARQKAESAKERGQESGLAPGAGSAHQLLVPVAGRVVRGWGAPTAAGPATGLSYRAAPDAPVRAPCAGRVLFAAPFRSYGKLLILECGGGYDAVLAGMAQLNATVGQVVRAGDLLGALPGAGRGAPRLYVELRHHGVAVDPAPWLHAGR